MLDFKHNISCPEGNDPDSSILQAAGGHAEIIRNPVQASKQFNLLVTDVWASLGQEDELIASARALEPYQVNDELMQTCRKGLFMHCLPAHRGDEVTIAVIDGPPGVVWNEAENRPHSQKALLEFFLLS